MLIKNTRLIDPASNFDARVDLLIKDGKIAKIAPKIETCEEVLDAEGLVCAPGFIDGHVHLREPGQTHKETIESGAAAGAAGGFTRLVAMANTKPIIDSPEELEKIQEKMRRQKIHIHSVAAISKGFRGEELTDFKRLKEAGAICLSDDGIAILKEETMERACKEAVKYDFILSLHEEDRKMIGLAGINEGKISKMLNMKGAPRQSEISMVKRDIAIAKKTGAQINIQHISAKESVDLVRQAKKEGVKVYAEATAHHFSLTDQAIVEFGSLAKVNPPLREEEDRLAIICGLKDGTIDMIATDHAPHTLDEKARAFEKCPSGMIGLETAFSLALKYLVEPGHLSLSQVIEKMSLNPAKIYKFDAGKVQEGKAADLVLFSTKEKTSYKDFKSKSSNTPFRGQSLLGKIKYTLVDGAIVYRG
ncbi:putative dihydroorotase [Clostridiales bacterium KA00134]|nr:putative dihydroorotase [Clostridiales bacterium KA00134]